jgi:transcriptional regulator with XRE-family HTH domain
MPRQADLANEAKLHQSRISMFETPGAANVTLETLSRLAAAFQVGVVVKFVPFSEMLKWENGFSQDSFNVTKIGDDKAFISPSVISRPTTQTQTFRTMRANQWKVNVSTAHGQWTAANVAEISAPVEQGANGTATVQTYLPFSAVGLQDMQEREAV